MDQTQNYNSLGGRCDHSGMFLPYSLENTATTVREALAKALYEIYGFFKYSRLKISDQVSKVNCNTCVNKTTLIQHSDDSSTILSVMTSETYQQTEASTTTSITTMSSSSPTFHTVLDHFSKILFLLFCERSSFLLNLIGIE